MTGLNVQMPDSLYNSLQEIATRDGFSIDQFIASAVAEKISELKKVGYLEKLAEQGSRKAYDAVLDQVPDVKPDPWDCWPSQQ